MENFLRLLSIFVVGFTVISAVNDRFQERFSWKQVDFAFPDEKTRKEAISSGEFIQAHNLPLGLEVWKDKLFVTLPRWKEGIAATLTYVKLNNAKEKSPKLIPYPNWDAHKIRKANNVTKITSVFRLNADVCDRLWFADQGITDIFGKHEQLYPAKIQIYNLNTDKLIKDYIIPKSILNEKSFLANIVVDVRKNNCDKAFAYIPDLGANSLLVYDLHSDDIWKVTHHYFSFDPLAGNYNVGGINFQWEDGIFGIALSPVHDDGYRTLYFHPMSSTREFTVSTKIVQNKTIASDSYHEYKVLGSRGPNTQATASGIDEKSGVMFYTLLNKDGVGCWNTKNEEYSADTNAVIASDSETMIFPNDLKVDKFSNVWVLTDRLPIMLYSSLNLTDVNYRIFSASVTDAIKGTICSRKYRILKLTQKWKKE